MSRTCHLHGAIGGQLEALAPHMGRGRAGTGLEPGAPVVLRLLS